MNYNLQPRAEFLANAENAKNHHTVVENPVVRRSLEVALAEMQHRAVDSTNPADFNACAASHLRMLGAKDFIAIFLNLVETQVPAVKSDTTNLPGNVRVLPQPTKRN